MSSKRTTESGAFRLRVNAADSNVTVFARAYGVRQRIPCNSNMDHSVGVLITMPCHLEHTRDKVKSSAFASRSSSVHNSVSASRSPTSEEVWYENISTRISAGKRQMLVVGAKPSLYAARERLVISNVEGDAEPN